MGNKLALPNLGPATNSTQRELEKYTKPTGASRAPRDPPPLALSLSLVARRQPSQRVWAKLFSGGRAGLYESCPWDDSAARKLVIQASARARSGAA